MLLKLAWRNIWRNKRRTLITAASVFTAVILAIVMRSAQLGSYQRMIDNVVSFYSGHIQIHQKGYWNEQSIDNSFEFDKNIFEIARKNQAITGIVPRLESFALISEKNLTKGVAVVGAEPIAENTLTHIGSKMVAGEYLKKGDVDAIISKGLAAYLKVDVNDTIVLIGQGYHAVSAAGKYRIKGIVHFPAPDMDQRMVYLSMKEAQNLYGTENRYTSIVISVQAGMDAAVVSNQIKSEIDTAKYEVMTWKEMMPEMMEMIEVDSGGGIIMIALLYMIIGFGIFGTILMMIEERKKEFGVMVAIGMKKNMLGKIVLAEILMITGLGVFAGVVVGFPIISWLFYHPIQLSGDLAAYYETFGFEAVFPFSNDWSIYSSQALAVIIISVVLSLFPWYSLAKLKVIDALKS